MIQPYTNTPITPTSVIREFSSEVDPMELIWHQDKEDRTIEILEGEGWQFQKDNELPLALQKGDRIFIPEYQIHRVIKGNTDLKIKITK
jgi:oxalate decarboxylase/phosphoglucose isomerase-like protein (cupin superfamily)